MKKTVCAVLALVFTILCFTGCGKQQPIVSMYELSREMLAALNTQETMLYVSGADADAAEKFAYVSDMDYSLVEDFFLLYAENGAGNADEIAVIAVKHPRSAPVAEASLCEHLSKRETLYASYDPGQLEKLQGAVYETVGRYVVLVVAADPAPVMEAFRQFVAP